MRTTERSHALLDGIIISSFEIMFTPFIFEILQLASLDTMGRRALSAVCMDYASSSPSSQLAYDQCMMSDRFEDKSSRSGLAVAKDE
jgi:hypothetical protein